MNGGSEGQLGRSLSVHTGTFGAGGWLWYVGAILVLAGFANLAEVAGLTGKQSGPTASVGVAAACFVIGVLVLIVPVLRWRQRVELFERGFVWQRLTGQRSFQRDDVRRAELVQHTSRSGTHMEVLVHQTDGSELSMSGLSHSDQLANLLRAYAQPSGQPGGTKGVAANGWAPPVV
jgi:hypothetical protein